MTIRTLIFIHDQDVLSSYLEKDIFNELGDVVFVFLGDGDVSRVRGNPRVIIARDLDHNLEHLPKLTSFTGWWAVQRNGFVTTDAVNLFEYDVAVTDPNAIRRIENAISTADVVGFVPYNAKREHYVKKPFVCRGLLRGIMDVYGVDFKRYVRSHERFFVSVTSNHSMKATTLDAYIAWVAPLLPYFEESPNAGDEIERSISAFYLLTNTPYTILDDCIEHYRLGSRRKQGPYVPLHDSAIADRLV
jgi:hypothetical protein